MKISVVIPAHNEEHVIEHTIRALLAQTHQEFEIIVVDNASTDRTSEVASQFPVMIVTEKRKGLLSARERGRLTATGEIVVNIDADCLPEPDWLSRGVSHFNDQRVVAVTGPYDYYDGGTFFRYTSLLTQMHIYYLVSKIVQHPALKKGGLLIGGNNFIRAEVLERMGGYNTAITFYGEDTDTAKRVARHGKIVFVPSLRMKTSARRFKSEGTVRITLKYLFHFFATLFRRQPATR